MSADETVPILASMLAEQLYATLADIDGRAIDAVAVVLAVRIGDGTHQLPLASTSWIGDVDEDQVTMQFAATLEEAAAQFRGNVHRVADEAPAAQAPEWDELERGDWPTT